MKKYYLLLNYLLLFFTSCNLFAKEKIPYGVEGAIVMDESDKYEYMGLELKFSNKSNLRVIGFTVVFFVFDENGEPSSSVKNNIVINVSCNIPSFAVLENCISLDNYVYVFEDVRYTSDYLYVSKIIYSDGTIWQDPFGTKSLY